MDERQHSERTDKNEDIIIENITIEKSDEVPDMKVISQQEENKSEETHFQQRFNAKKKDKTTTTEVVSIRSLFQYATVAELFYLIIAVIASAVFGVALPLSLIVFGDAVNSFTYRSYDLCSLNFTSLTQQYCPLNVTLTSINFYTTIALCNFTGTNYTNINYDLKSKLSKPINMALIIACISLISGYIRVTFSNISAERQSRSIRQILFRSILNKDLVYFDQHKTGELSLYLTDNINKISDGMGDKLCSSIEMISTFISGLAIGFSRGWKLSLVVLSLAPVIFITITILFKVITKLTIIQLKTYGKAGAIAEEVISSIRTVISYNGQEKEIQRYEQYLDDARKCGVKKGFISGVSKGVTYFLLFCIYALGFWYGTKLVWEENYTIGHVFTIFMSINFAVFSLGQASPYFQAVYEARVAAFILWQVISEPSKINNDSEKGITKDDLSGDIQFSNVQFSYPSRPDVSILTNLSFEIKQGQTIALVGSSGSGKSTCIQLLQRFYDPQSGSILIDGKNVNEYNLQWLRQHIGVVSQEPVLFHTTIRQNISLGHDSATDEQIHEAAKMANAHDFIMTLPDKYETQVGERGSALSGGQKQRIAIARALLRNPKILLLDEATSALDNESEQIVQEALDRAAQGRTTLIIAHRLSTIRNVDRIIVMQKGEIVEEGDHDRLMEAKGIYYTLVEQQTSRQVEEAEGLEFNQEEATNTVLPEAPETLLPEAPKTVLPETTMGTVIKPRPHRSTIFSITPSVLLSLYQNRTSNVSEYPNENQEKTTKMKEKKRNTTLNILRMNKPEWVLIAIGCITASLNGSREPAYSIIQTKLAIVFQECDKEEQQRQVSLYVYLYLALGILSFLLNSLQGYVFARSGEAVTKRLRSKAFQAILRQEIAFFDNEKHSTGALCTRLATEASAVQGASGVRLGLILEHLFSIGVGLIIAFIYSWQLTLLNIGFLPFILFGGILQIRITARYARRDKQILEDGGKVAMEAIQNIRTVVQLTKETHFYDQYSQILDTVYRSSLKRIHISSIVFSVTSAVLYFAIAAFISLSGYLVDQGTITFESVFMVVTTVVFTSRIVGRALTLFPDYGKAMEAAENIFELLNRKPAIDNESKDGDMIANFTGAIELDSVYFNYPNRSKSVVLKNFKLNIKPGQRVALVGTSGCGKSTTIQLIERFYDPNTGSLLADSKDIRSLNLQWYRSQIGIVSQEPVLFNMSIRENIAYGDNSRKDIPFHEIIQAAKIANIHDFITCLPKGYETMCGSKGAQLSGGQKQRIAIARALIRNPKILLLDEATSALDSESERIVQEALDGALKDRTSITIAHRLSTIQNADMICVLHNGVIVESGSHDELFALGGRYYRLVEGGLK